MPRVPAFPALLLGCLASAVPGVAAQDAAAVFARYSGAVAKIEVLEARTATPESVGTAFFVSPNLAVTNFHVVRGFVFGPSTSIVQLAFQGGATTRDLRIVAVDPVQDLAIIDVATPHAEHLELASGNAVVGETLFSLGHPADLSTSVVQGTFNGAVEHSAAPRFHFTGSINPGMSGGPTVTAGGTVVGVNVSTAGNQLSFLIPASSVAPLVDEARLAAGAAISVEEDIGARLYAFQAGFFDRLLGAPLPTTTIGSLAIPIGPDALFDCSASPYDIEEDRYQVIEHTCYTNDEIMLGPEDTYPVAYLEHMYVSAEDMGRARFSALYNSWFQTLASWEVPQNDEATDYLCRQSNAAANAGGKLRLVYCLRRHARFEELYDVFIRTALLTDAAEGTVGTFRAFAISFENSTRLLERMVEGYRWPTR
ncbi:MAG: serine protease [Longimicrobiales bacterium]